MKTYYSLLLIWGVAFFNFFALHVQAAPDGTTIEQITGLKGALNEAEGVFKVTSPRSDIKVSVDGWQIPPFMGLMGCFYTR